MNKTLDVVILGAGGHGQALADVIEATRQFRIFGYLDDFQPKGASVRGYPVVGNFQAVPEFVSDTVAFAIGIGQIKSSRPRQELFQSVRSAGGQLPVIVSPHSYVSPNSTIGSGTVVFHGAIVNVGAVIGENCIINSMALIEHDVRVEDHCHVSTGARVNGGARIGASSFIGSSAIVIQEQEVAANSIVPAGARWRPSLDL